jgi:asparagine synthase (glutamine-hydrolysing)
MAGALAHRGPDAGGVWTDPRSGVALGHRRLAILDLSEEGAQPMRSRCGRYVISFNGEIYNYRALRDELAGAGHKFRGGSDTEVMLAAIAEWGLDYALDRFNGMFAFALWDAHARRLHLARDRAGEKPLYYGYAGRSLVFGSELKALRAHPDFRAGIDRGALALYVRHGYIPAPHTIYQGIRKLEAGSVLTAGASGEIAAARPYWSLESAVTRGLKNPLSGSTEEAQDEVEALLRDSVKMRMEADVPLGAFLSGGVDSSIVAGMMQAQSSKPVRTFTIGFNKSSYNEAEQASAVARHLGTEHTELYVTPAEAMSVIPRLGAIYDEPFADASQIPTVLVSELARRHVTVSLSGDGGDELFGGYTRYMWTGGIWRRTGWAPQYFKTLGAAALTAVSVERWDAGFRILGRALPPRMRQRNPGEKIHKLAGALRAGTPEAMYLGLLSQWSDPASLVRGATEPATALSDPARRFGPLGIVPLMMAADTAAYLPDDLLVKVDRASMSVGLEARAPLLDHRLIELAWRVPLSMKIRNGRGKWLLRNILNRYVPKGLTERPKMGFDVPIHDWLRGPMRSWSEDLLSESRLRREGFFDAGPIRRRWSEHAGGARNWQDSLWSILMFEAWLEETKSAPSGEPAVSSVACVS